MIQIGSCDCSKTEIEMQAVPPTMTTMEDTRWTDYHPIASLDSHHAPIEFAIPPQTENYTDLSQSYLYLRCRILRAGVGNNLEAGKKVAPVNNFFHSMFSSIDMCLNNKLVTSNMDTYPHRAYLENLFSFGSGVKQNQLRAGEFWYQDATGKFVDWDADIIQKRMAAVEENKPLELMGRLHLDLAMQEKYLPNGIEINLRLNRASPKFCLMVGEDPVYPSVVNIDVAKVLVRTVQLLPAIINDFNQAIAQKQAKFPIRRVEVKTFTINTGFRSKIEDHFFQDQLPKRLFIGMLTNEEFNGSFVTNPFRFTPFRLSKLDVSCDGHNIYG